MLALDQPSHLSLCLSHLQCWDCMHAPPAKLGFPVSIIPSGIHKEPPRGPSVQGWHWLGRLTNVQDAVPRPAPPPALQLLVLHVLQTAVMKDYTDDTLWKADVKMALCRD